MKKLAAWGVAVLGGWYAYHRVSDHITVKTDSALLGYISFAALGCVAVQIIWTWKWRSLSLGLLSFFLATTLLYIRVSTTGPGYELWWNPAMLSLIRTLFLIGSTLTLWGLALHAWRNRHRAFPWWRKRHEDADPFNVPESESPT